jgi:hypothetical protein
LNQFYDDIDFANKQRTIELKILSKIKDPNNQKYRKGYTEYNGKIYSVTSLIKGKDLTKHSGIAIQMPYFKN